MATFSSNPVEQQSPYGDGRYLLRMLLGDRTAPTPDMAPPMEEQAIAPPRNLTPLASDVYVDDPASNAEINPLAPASAGRSKPTPSLPTPPISTQPSTPPIPQAKPSVAQTLSPSQQGVSDIMDNMRTMLDGNSASAGQSYDDFRNQHNQQLGNDHEARVAREVAQNNAGGGTAALNNIDGNPAPSGEEDSGWGWGDTAKATGIAALIAAILTGRGRSAGGVADASRGVTPYDPGRSGTILGRDQITDQRPTPSNINPNQIETDILSVSPDHSRFIEQDADNYWDRSAAGAAGDVEGANSPHTYINPRAAPPQAEPAPKPEFTVQGKPQSVTPDVINQSGPDVQRGLTSQGVQYRGRTYYMDEKGNITDKNGDIVNSSAVPEIKARFGNK